MVEPTSNTARNAGDGPLYELPYQRVPHPIYDGAHIPAYHMIRFSVAIQRGCFGGCTFCSITEHEGRIIQNRSEDSIVREVETIRDNVPGFTGVVSDLGGPTANMYRISCKSPEIEASCRRPSCVFPGICKNLNTNHSPLIRLYRRAGRFRHQTRVYSSGVRYDLAIESRVRRNGRTPRTVTKIAPEHTERGPLDLMMKPGMGTYYRFKELFDRYSKAAGKEQYLIPYFIAAHPGTTDEDMLNLALWLKSNGYRADQVQAFLPGPMATATAMYRSGRSTQADPLNAADVPIPKGARSVVCTKRFCVTTTLTIGRCCVRRSNVWAGPTSSVMVSGIWFRLGSPKVQVMQPKVFDVRHRYAPPRLRRSITACRTPLASKSDARQRRNRDVSV